MTIKKTAFIAATLALSLALVGCSSSDSSDNTSSDDSDDATEASTIADAGDWTDGTYTATVTGKKGDFDVTVVIEDGYIASIEIGENNETESKGGVAIAQLPDEIVDAQSTDVDTVSGATITSEAIIEGVNECLEEASK